jgi:hypothetical protein
VDNDCSAVQLANEMIAAYVGYVSPIDATTIKNELQSHRQNYEKHKGNGNNRKAQKCQESYWHTLGELVAGAFVASHGIKLDYKKAIGRQKPDWFLTDRASGRESILEVFSLDPDERILADLRDRGIAAGWRIDRANINEIRLWSSLNGKAAKYKRLVNDNDLGFIIAGHACFELDLRMDDIAACLDGPEGLFQNHREVTGVLIFGPRGKSNNFKWFFNRYSGEMVISLRDGIFPAQ